MTVRPLLVFLFLLSLPVLLQNCAQVASPPGGKKDTLAPKLVVSTPKNRQLNYQGKTIELYFDEYISAENLQQKLLITPQDTNPYIVRQVPQGLKLVFNDNFKPNTTYTISFADAIRDVTERNVAENPKLVFSTGSAIDSLHLGGTILDSDTKKPIFNMVVGLFGPNDTLPVQRKRPSYFARTDTNGIYLIENIKAGLYQPYAFQDADLNLVNNQPGERVGFRDTLVNLNRNYDDIDLIGFRGFTKPRITRRERTDETMGIELSSGIASYRMKPQPPPRASLTPADSVVAVRGRAELLRVYEPTGR
ncbi:MAG: Ig-like domain-containing protein, partial [Rudanella sp.]|nr:Ig-like domain-containing protein [Rudanella sp.]